MIIDSHLHFGEIAQFHMPQKNLIETINKYKIDFGIVSNIEACEFDINFNRIPKEDRLSQLDANIKTLELVKKYPNKLKGQFWIKPYEESFTDEVADFMLKNKDYFVGFKVHPHHSNLKITDKRCEAYLEFANEYGLPVAVHTAEDENSDPYHVYEVAKKYPNVNFIMVHMGLRTDNMDAIKYIAKSDNIYGDTTWVSLEKVAMAVKECGSDKILFGTDNPISGLGTYEKYKQLINEGKNLLKEEDYKKIFYLNAIKMFSLDSKKLLSE